MNMNNTPVANLIIDMDGVLWHGETAAPDLVQFFQRIDQLGLDYVLATNNASRTPSQYSKKLDAFGVPIAIEKILTSAVATANYLTAIYPPGSEAYVVGDIGLREALLEQGYRILPNAPVDLARVTADFVVAGMTRDVCYEHLSVAAHLINKGSKFFGTNPDLTFPTEIGPLPGAGSILAFISSATGVDPVVVGKPNPIMFQEALRRLSGSEHDTVMIGDRLTTDIAGAQASGMRAILLLSGISRLEDLEQSAVKPHWIFNTLSELASALGTEVPLEDRS